MKILGTLTVDTPNALDKVTDLNADLLDGKSSEQYLSRGLGDFNYAANYERSSVDNNTEDTSITLGRDTILTSTDTKVANSSLILKTGGLNNNGTTSNSSTLTLYKNGDSPSGNTIILGSAGIVNTSGALILNNNSSGDFLIKQGATNEVRLRIAENVTYLGNFTNASIGGATATYVAKFDTALVVGTPTTAATSPAVFIGRFNRTVGATTNSEASVAGIDYKGNILTGLSIIGKSIVFRTDDTGTVADSTISDRMVISSTGLIGIGLASPTTMLQIKPNTGIDLIKCTDTAGTKTLLHVDSVGRVGINAVGAAGVQLALTGVSGTTSTARIGVYNKLTHNITEPASAVFGIHTGVTVNSTNASTLDSVYGLYVDTNTLTGDVVVQASGKYGIYQAGAADSNVFNGATTFSNAFTLSAVTNTINIGGVQTSGVLTLGGALQTGIITLGRSTATHTLNIDAGVTTSGNTKYINIGTGGVAGSTTTITFGTGGVAGSTTTITYGSTIGTTHTFNGNVGIGTNAPGAPLDVSVNTSGTNNVIVGEYTTRLTSGTAAAGMGIGKMFSLEDAGGNLIGTGGIRSYWVDPAIAVRSSNTDIQASLANLTRTVATFTSAGNALIGKTTDDGNKLQVNGSASIYDNDPVLHMHGLASTGLHNIEIKFYNAVGTNIAGIGASFVGGITELYNKVPSQWGFSWYIDSANVMKIASTGNVGIGTTTPTEKLHVVGNILATGTVSGSNISNSYVWVFVITSTSTAYNTSDAYNASNNYVKPRTGDTVGSAFTDSATLPSFYNKNVVVYRSTTTSSYSAYEQVFPDITITTGGVCTISFAVAQTVGYVFRVIFS